MPAPVPTKNPRVPAQRRVPKNKKNQKKHQKKKAPAQRRLPIEAGGEARVVFGELTRRTRVRRVVSVGAMIASDN